MYLERADSIQMANGPKPTLYMRRQCVPPRYDTKPYWEIIRELAKRLDLVISSSTKRSKTSGTFSSRTWNQDRRLQLQRVCESVEKSHSLDRKEGSNSKPFRQTGVHFQPDGEKRVSLLRQVRTRGASARRGVPVDRGSKRCSHARRHTEQSLSERAGA